MKIKALAAVAALASAGVLSGGSAALAAQPDGQAFFDISAGAPAEPTRLTQAQFFWGARNWCFYPDGWRGPGYYWCGYAYRRGYGWGGPIGWHGWNWHRAGPGGFRDDRPGFRGGPGGFQGGAPHGGPEAFHGGAPHGGPEAFHGGGGDHGGGGHPGGGGDHHPR
jgi:hypothetical protein